MAGAKMSLSDLASLGSFVSGVAVLISLVFLYFQLRQVNAQVRQAERNQRALLQHGRAGRAADTNFELANRAELLSRVALGDRAVTGDDFRRFHYVSQAIFFGFEDTYYHHCQGMLDDASFESSLASMRAWLAMPGSRAWWRTTREWREPGFRAVVDALEEAAPLGPRADIVVVWKEELAREQARVAAPL